MRVSLSPDVFTSPTALTDLLDLLRSFSTGRHDLIADPKVIDAATKYLAEHAPKHTDAFRTLAPKMTVAAVWGSGSLQGTVIRVTDATLEDHAADLRAPAVLVVEDQDSDGDFIVGLCTALRVEHVLRAIKENWLEIAHGGGSGGVPRVALARARRFRLVTRVAVLLDSDRLLPGEGTQAHAKQQSLTASGVPTHVLEFREAENYVPDQVIGAIIRRRDTAIRLTIFGALSQEQRAFFDMKRGFRSEGGVPARQVSLYANLSRQVAQGLQSGFGDDLLGKFKEASGSLTERDFEALGANVVAELQRLIAMLVSVI